jgi:hypothetical protein
MRGPVILLVALLLPMISSAGCSSEQPAATAEVAEQVATIVVEARDVSPLADSPSAVLVQVTGESESEEHPSAVAEVKGASGQVVFPDLSVPAGEYSVHVAQLPCPMTGEECPSDADASEYSGVAAVWECDVDVSAAVGQQSKIAVMSAGDANKPDAKSCSVV